MTTESQEISDVLSKKWSVVIDRDGNPWGPFSDSAVAAMWAMGKWPDQEQDTEGGWDIVAVLPPD